MVLAVCSKSTRKFLDDWNFDELFVVDKFDSCFDVGLKDSETNVIAVGGGYVIDVAKIISCNPIVAVPTTFAGASRTSHAVLWNNRQKIDVETCKPVTVLKPKYVTLSKEQLNYSKADCLSHIVECLISNKKTVHSTFLAVSAMDLVKRGDWLNASLLAGDAIDLIGTNLIHALSYPLTLLYGYGHGQALCCLLPKFCKWLTEFKSLCDCIVFEDLVFDVEKVVSEGLKYSKAFGSNLQFTKENLVELLS